MRLPLQSPRVVAVAFAALGFCTGCDVILGIEVGTDGGPGTGGEAASGGTAAAGGSTGGGGIGGMGGSGGAASEPCGTVVALADDFDGQVLSPVWTVQKTATASVDQQSGAVRFMVSNGEFGRLRSTGNHVFRDNELIVDLPLVSLGNIASWNIDFLDASEEQFIRMVVHAEMGMPHLYIREMHVTATMPEPRVDEPYSSSFERIRLVEEEGTVSVFTAPRGTDDWMFHFSTQTANVFPSGHVGLALQLSSVDSVVEAEVTGVNAHLVGQAGLCHVADVPLVFDEGGWADLKETSDPPVCTVMRGPDSVQVELSAEGTTESCRVRTSQAFDLVGGQVILGLGEFGMADETVEIRLEHDVATQVQIHVGSGGIDVRSYEDWTQIDNVGITHDRMDQPFIFLQVQGDMLTVGVGAETNNIDSSGAVRIARPEASVLSYGVLLEDNMPTSFSTRFTTLVAEALPDGQ